PLRLRTSMDIQYQRILLVWIKVVWLDDKDLYFSASGAFDPYGLSRSDVDFARNNVVDVSQSFGLRRYPAVDIGCEQLNRFPDRASGVKQSLTCELPILDRLVRKHLRYRLRCNIDFVNRRLSLNRRRK